MLAINREQAKAVYWELHLAGGQLPNLGLALTQRQAGGREALEGGKGRFRLCAPVGAGRAGPGGGSHVHTWDWLQVRIWFSPVGLMRDVGANVRKAVSS